MNRLLPPLMRIAVAALWAAAALLAASDRAAGIVYAGGLAYLVAAHCWREHLRFFLFAGFPLLLALLLTWGLVMPLTHAAGATTVAAGVHHALLIWLRILILAGVCQWLLLPLVRQPLQLRGFVAALGLPASIGVLLAMPVLVLPEVQRQIRQVGDARRVQQMPTRGIRGALALPATIVPVMAALIETALNRAELWEHRGLLADRAAPVTSRWTPWWSAWVSLVLPVAVLWWEMAA